uniref:Uncharacterized protein n=1 Tax=Brassica oleracea var. oleracea TaxID=109376 RepID=A0A0D3DKA9_BRAOL
MKLRQRASIEDEIRASGSDIPIQKVKANPGFNFMTMICERRQCLMHGSNKKDRSGSLLTPLFKYFGIDLSKYSVNKEVQYLDIKYLMACHIMRDEETYSFFDKAAPDADMEDVEDITPEAEPSYDLGELADVTNDQAYRRWMVDSQRKNNSLMRRILHLITGGYIGGSNQRQPPAEQTPRSHRPGKAPMGTGTSTEEADLRFISHQGWCKLSLGEALSSHPIRLHWVDSPPPNLNLILTEILLVMGTRSGKRDPRSGLLILFTNLADPEWLAHFLLVPTLEYEADSRTAIVGVLVRVCGLSLQLVWFRDVWFGAGEREKKTDSGSQMSF